MGITGFERDYYGHVKQLAANSDRIASALEELAAQGRDPEVTRARNLAALTAEAALAAEIPTPPGTTRLHTEHDVCNVNRCTNPPVPGTDFCAQHQDRA